MKWFLVLLAVDNAGVLVAREYIPIEQAQCERAAAIVRSSNSVAAYCVPAK
jgi:hypothetical protein